MKVSCPNCGEEFLNEDDYGEDHFYTCSICGLGHDRCVDGEEEDILHEPSFYIPDN